MGLQELVIVTGMSGSGKGTVLNAFEDLGFFCIDNLPIGLIPKFIEGFHVSGGEVERAALGIDIRAGEKLIDFEKTLKELRKLDFRVFSLYIEARDTALVRRFSETRRPHPLAAGKTLSDAIRLERKRLRKIRELADVTVDSSEFSPHEMKAFVTRRFRSHTRPAELNIHLLSFGYKYGIPLEADLLFDVRFLPNPYFIKGLRGLCGTDRPVVAYLRSFPETKEFTRRLKEFMQYLVPFYVREGKSYLTVGVGCTGGRHRSVFIAAALAKLLKIKGVTLKVRHRDAHRHLKTIS